jgi:hypothetical protein
MDARVVAIGAVVLLLALGCGSDDSKGKGPAGGSEAPGATGGEQGGSEGGEGFRPGEIRDDGPGGRTTLTRHELGRQNTLSETLYNTLRFPNKNDFREIFLKFDVLKSILVKAGGGDEKKWLNLPENAGLDNIELKKRYWARIDTLFEGLGNKSRFSDLPAERFRTADRGIFLFADTFHTELDKNMIVGVHGFAKGEGLVGLLRFRFATYRNQEKVFLVDDEKLRAAESCNETAAAEVLGIIRKLEEAFRKSGKCDRDKDGRGEFGFLAEVMGLYEIRGTTERAPLPEVPRALREVSVNGMMVHKGFLFTLYLPGSKGPVSKDDCDGIETKALTDARETRWVAYAWPVHPSLGKGRTLVTDASGALFESADPVHQGLDGAPRPEDAFVKGQGLEGDLSGAAGKEANRGGVWKKLE